MTVLNKTESNFLKTLRETETERQRDRERQGERERERERERDYLENLMVIKNLCYFSHLHLQG